MTEKLLTGTLSLNTTNQPINEKFIYFSTKSCKLQNNSGQIEKIWSVKSSTIRENTHIIARSPLISIQNYYKFYFLHMRGFPETFIKMSLLFLLPTKSSMTRLSSLKHVIYSVNIFFAEQAETSIFILYGYVP